MHAIPLIYYIMLAMSLRDVLKNIFKETSASQNEAITVQKFKSISKTGVFLKQLFEFGFYNRTYNICNLFIAIKIPLGNVFLEIE